MCLHGFLWVPIGPYEFLLILMNLCGSLWVLMRLSGSLWVLVCPDAFS